MSHRFLSRAFAALALSTLFLALPAAGAVPDGPPRVSPMASVSQVVGVSEVTVTYSRPSVKEREVWGGLVPYDKVWRTGANEATAITFSDAVKINGKPLAAGSYALFTIPGKNEWKVIFNKKAEQWGAYNREESEDALSIQVKPSAADHQESFLVSFPKTSATSTTASLRWEKVDVRFEIAFDVQQAALDRGRALVEANNPEEGRALWSWANYLYQEGAHTEEAQKWAGSLSENAPMYWTHALYSRLLAHHGQHGKALTVAAKALEKAKEEAEERGVKGDSEKLATELAKWKKASAN